MDNLTQIHSPRASVEIEWCQGLPRINLRLDDPKYIERTVRRIAFANVEEALVFLRSLAVSVEAAIGQSEQQQDQGFAPQANDDAIPVMPESSPGFTPALYFDVGQDDAGYFADVQIAWGRSNEIQQSISFVSGTDLVQFMGKLVVAAYVAYHDARDQVQDLDSDLNQ